MKFRHSFLLWVALCFLSFLPDKKTCNIWLIGDSTMSIKEVKAYPEAGWGMPFVYFFDSSIVVENRALNGRSTRTFMAEKRWQPVVDNMQAGDFVFIQFGHNDEVKEKASYTTPDDFTANLTKYVQETRAKNATPILLTPVARRKFDSTGKVVDTHEHYAGLVQKLAADLKVPFIDLNKKSLELYQQMGVETSKLLFLQLKPGEHPNYPNGKDDNTHFNELGARLIAQLVLAEVKKLDIGLNKKIIVR